MFYYIQTQRNGVFTDALRVTHAARSGLLKGKDVDGDYRKIRTAQNLWLQDREAMRNGSFTGIDGVVLDLGLSSIQLADDARGFSFRASGPLDMRSDPRLELTAADLVNTWEERDLRRIFTELGEEPEAARVAGAIVRRRARGPFIAADEFGRFVAGVKTRRPGKIDPATRVFQALRMAVNDELGSLARGLEAALAALAPAGRLAIISFHSLEDRIVKQFIRKHENDGRLTRITKKPIIPSADELQTNPRSRSAKLRIAERI